MRRRLSAVLGMALAAHLACDLGAPRSAFAQDSAAAAEVLFSDARALADKGDFAAACPKFAESQRLDPGMGTLYNLGDCYEHVGRTASAWAAFREVASQAQAAGQSARETDARQRAAVLEKVLTRVTIEVRNPPPGVVIERDGVRVGAAQWGLSLPLDPGPHTLVVKAPAKKDWTKTFDVPQKGAMVVPVPVLEDAPPEPALPRGPDAETGPTNAGRTQRTIGLVVSGVGVAALGVVAVFGLISMGHKSDVDKNCSAVNGCNADGAAASESAVHTGNASTGFFIGGAVLVAGGVLLFATAPASNDHKKAGAATRIQAMPLVTPSLAGAGMSGSW